MYTEHSDTVKSFGVFTIGKIAWIFQFFTW